MQVFAVSFLVQLLSILSYCTVVFWSLSSKMPHDITRASEDKVKKIEALPQYVFAGIPICPSLYDKIFAMKTLYFFYKSIQLLTVQMVLILYSMGSFSFTSAYSCVSATDFQPFFILNPSSIYSCSIDHILEHEFCHLGSKQAVSEKFLKRQNFCLSMLLFGVVFSTF